MIPFVITERRCGWPSGTGSYAFCDIPFAASVGILHVVAPWFSSTLSIFPCGPCTSFTFTFGTAKPDVFAIFRLCLSHSWAVSLKGSLAVFPSSEVRYFRSGWSLAISQSVRAFLVTMTKLEGCWDLTSSQ